MRPVKFAVLILCLFFLARPLSARAQSTLQNFYRPAAHLWMGDTSLAAPRRLLPLNGVWQAASNEPRLAGPVEVPGAFLFEGELRFERSFHLADSLRSRTLRLHFAGLNHEARIAVNGVAITNHSGGYLAFTADLRGEILRFGQANTLTVTVDNRLSAIGSLPPRHRPMGWRNEGGIIREVFLEILPEIHFAEYEFKYALDNSGVHAEFFGRARTGRDLPVENLKGLAAVFEIWDLARARKLASSPPQPLSAWQMNRHDVSLSCRLPDPALWSPASPNLYALRAVLMQEKSPRERNLIDEIWQETGFREVKLSGKELWLNGEHLTLRGIDWIEEYGETALLDTLRLQNLFNKMKQLGANALRVIGHPPHPALPAWCDRAGIFLLEELPWYYLTDAHYRHPRFAQTARLQIAEMVRRDRHHPSVLAWGLGVAGAPSSAAAQKVAADLASALRAQDSRLLYVVTPPAWQALWQPHADLLLVPWLKRGNLDSLVQLQDRSAKPVLPVLGCHVSAMQAGAENELNTAGASRGEEAQAEYFTRVFKTLRERPRAGGYFLHSLFDWQGPMPYLAAGILKPAPEEAVAGEVPGDWSRLNRFAGSRLQPWGIMTREGRPRPAFESVRAYNQGEGGPAPGARRGAADHPAIFQIAGIGLIVAFLFILQRDRRLRASLRRVFVHPHGFYHDLYEHRKVASFLTTVVGLAESAVVAFLLAQFCYAFRHSLGFDQVLNLLFPAAGQKALAVWLIWHPGWFMLWGTAAVFALGLVLGFLFRLLGVLVGTSVPLTQYITSVYWAWANLILLGALTPVFYRVLLNADAWRPLLMLVIAFKIWVLVRMFRAVRVLYMASYFRAALICILVLGGLSFAAWLYFDRSRALTDYARYYLSMLRLLG